MGRFSHHFLLKASAVKILLAVALAFPFLRILTLVVDIRPAVAPSESSSPPQPQATGPPQFCKLGSFTKVVP